MKIQLLSLLACTMLALIACEPPDNRADAAPDYEAFDADVEVIRALIAAHEAEDLEVQRGMLADTMQWSPPYYNSNEWLGKGDYLSALQGYHNDFDNIRFEEGIVTPDSTVHGMWSGSVFPEETATNEPTVIRVYGTLTATHVESGVDTGVKWFALCAVNDAGQITSLSEYFDVHGIAAQIEAATAEEAGEEE